MSESDGCPSGYAGRMGETVYVQRHSKVSESDGCPSGYAGHMGGTVYVQRLSKVSELVAKQTITKMYSLCLCVSVVKNEQAQRLSKVSEMLGTQGMGWVTWLNRIDRIN